MADNGAASRAAGSPRHALILGGARSGKTARALALASAFAHKIYVATAEAHDEEMRVRIARHARERGSAWMTIEAPLRLAAVLDPASGGATWSDRPASETAIVVDCLTLWLSNLMHAGRDLEAESKRLVAALATTPAHVVLVSNEVGLGIVPENALARAFRDAQGRLNQEIARVVGTVDFVAAGLPLRLKG